MRTVKRLASLLLCMGIMISLIEIPDNTLAYTTEMPNEVQIEKNESVPIEENVLFESQDTNYDLSEQGDTITPYEEKDEYRITVVKEEKFKSRGTVESVISTNRRLAVRSYNEGVYFDICDNLMCGGSVTILYGDAYNTSLDDAYAVYQNLERYMKSIYWIDKNYNLDIIEPKQVFDETRQADGLELTVPLDRRIYYDEMVYTVFKGLQLSNTQYTDEEELMLAIQDRIYGYFIYSRDYSDKSLAQCFHAHHGVCWAYAECTIVLANYYNLPTRYVIGKSEKGGRHGWVQVKMNGTWHDVDVTNGGWDKEVLSWNEIIPLDYPAIIVERSYLSN